MNNEVGRAESMATTDVVEVGGRHERENIFHKLNMTGHKDFIKDKVKTKKGT